jgi:hypothetical protein
MGHGHIRMKLDQVSQLSFDALFLLLHFVNDALFLGAWCLNVEIVAGRGFRRPVALQ